MVRPSYGNEEDIIYILTKADVEDIAKDIGITNPFVPAAEPWGDQA